MEKSHQLKTIKWLLNQGSVQVMRDSIQRNHADSVDIFWEVDKWITRVAPLTKMRSWVQLIRTETR